MRRLRSSGFLRWSSLPAEIRNMILNTIADLRNPRWSALASVSKEWQSVIGARNMAKLELRTVPCVQDVEKITQQRGLVRHIYLKLEQPRHYLPSVGKVMSWALPELLYILSTWKTTGPLTLEINAVSPKDEKRWGRDFRFDDDHDASNRDLTASETDRHEPRYTWEIGDQVIERYHPKMPDLFRPVKLSGNFNWRVIKHVTAVTCLMIRRQFRRFITPADLELLFSKLDCLTDVVYESWSPEYTDGPWGWTAGSIELRGVVPITLPEPLKRLIIFRDSVEYITRGVRIFRMYHPLPSWRGDGTSMDHPERNSRRLAQTSLRLEELSISFIIDAEDFFAHCDPTWTWEHLHSLALTSNLLQNGKDHETEVNTLLLTMAKYSMRMPALKTLVLWSGSAGNACAFIFTRREKCANILWRGTWTLRFYPEVLDAWRDVAMSQSWDLRSEFEHIQKTIKNHGDALHYLNLPCKVIEPTSLWQIRKESA
ncbi:hypothetical protein FLONG3_4587 [Fusarium longipes]|uniref:DUF6546 domain-containing protein n=1 Tax=Fusarium longipes TaxID=694270 RepID=A0A395SYT9_9HYPO|nr:hypothetical protein FLONG3_4587 [Fusarium longipes]